MFSLGTWAWLLGACAMLLLSGCAGVTVSSVSPSEYLVERRGDVLTTGRLSTSAQEVLRVIGSDAADCQKTPDVCRRELAASTGLTDEQRLSALSEVWLHSALRAEQGRDALPPDQDAELDNWLESARHAWAYLFFTSRKPGTRAFEDRQSQVRDYYNFAAQRAATALFQRYRSERAGQAGAPWKVAGWTIVSETRGLRLPQDAVLPEELIPATTLRFSGVRNTYRRDGFGVEFVAAMTEVDSMKLGADRPAYREMPFPAVTALLSFPGESLAEVLATRELQVAMYDPYRTAQVEIAGLTMPLAGNFTSGYGLWLARSGFAVQSLRTLLGREDGITRPRIHLMQPYDPQRRIIVMLHGLASSPEAWINVANEVLGDEELRRHYQIWQVYYPTNAPLAANNHTIREALGQTLSHFDPAGTAQASRDMVLIGHSMGGVLSRLMVSSSGDRLWDMLPASTGTQTQQARRAREALGAYLKFEPLPQVTRTVFIAAPQRGTPFANNRFSRWASNLVTLPLTMIKEFAEITSSLAYAQPSAGGKTSFHIPNSIDNLSDRDAFVRGASDLPISPLVRYHTIMGNDTPDLPLAESADGIVPYASAHLAGAESELVLASGHSVQENPRAILEIRRILREHLH